MRRFAAVMALALAAGVPSYSLACDATQPKCAAVNTLLERLGYGEKLLEGQRLCEANTEHLSPEQLHSKGVTRLLPLKKGGDGWVEANEAHRRFVAATCGGEEVVQVLQNIYRNEWMASASEDELIKLAKTPDAMNLERVRTVNRAAATKAAALLGKMYQAAFADYEREIKGLAERGGQVDVAAQCPNGQKDERTQTCKTGR